MQDSRIRGLSDLYVPEEGQVEEPLTSQDQEAAEEVSQVVEDGSESTAPADQEEKIEYNFNDIISDMTEVEVVTEAEDDFEDLEKMAGQSPVIKFVNYLISDAIKKQASDIHIEPKEKFTKVRYRIDGALFEIMQAPSQMHSAIVSRIKI
ncbi:MAG: ATPase, T2SS/T4P/T4SS family, partial [Planctomycetota bacterium]